MNLSPRHAVRKNPLLLKSLTVTDELLPNIEDILTNCKKIVHLRIGHIRHELDDDGPIWDGNKSTNDGPLLAAGLPVVDDSDEDASDEDDEHELDVKLIASNLNELKTLHIGSGLQLCRQPIAPPTFEQLLQLEILSLCPIRPLIRSDRSRDEWNLRILAQSSEVLRVLDLRGCYLKIFSLGWLKTKKLQSLHLFYQVPAASVLVRWSTSLKYLTLVRVSVRYKCYRSMGPERPGEELDACINSLAMCEDSKLEQLDLRESDCSLAPLRLLVSKCRRLTYLDTRGCSHLPSELQDQFIDSTEILEHFT